ncbi:MAG TPA: calcium-binding protein [Sphingomicrobium sp.]|jgi:Ca2+-binding RTX toxin-like protein|nr:calcium-binding protein [Sphingomicrobium sp.]
MGVYNGNRRDDVINGSKRDDFINGKEGNDQLFGNDGNDRLYGGTGNDLLDGGNGADRLEGESGNDTLRGGAGMDLLNGGIGNDSLDGGADNDSITGNLGADQLTGGAGFDSFIYVSQNESNAANGIDLITDYTPGEDQLEFGGDLAWIDANPALAGQQSWQYVGDAHLAGELANGNGQATLTHAGGVTTLTLYRYGSTDAYMTFNFQGDYAPGEIEIVANGTTVPMYDVLVY